MLVNTKKKGTSSHIINYVNQLQKIDATGILHQRSDSVGILQISLRKFYKPVCQLLNVIQKSSIAFIFMLICKSFIIKFIVI